MADREGDQKDASAQDCSSSIPNLKPKDEPREQPAPADPSPQATSQVRNTVLKEIAAHQAKRITELERTLEKKRATIKRLSAAPQIPHPVIPMVPQTAMPVPPPPASAGTQNGSAQTTSVGTPQASMPTPSTPIPIPSGLPPHSQPQSVPNVGAHNAAMAAPLVGFPPPQPHLAAGFPYMFPHPDPSFAASYMGVVAPAALNHLQPLQSRAPKQSAQKDKNNDGSERKQSRYWTADEHQRFLAGVKACGPKNYLQISEYVGTRNAKQVRTHAQKFQKRREREEAKLRNDMRHGRTEVSAMASVGAAAKAAVEAAAEAAMQGKVPGASSKAKDCDSVGTQAGPSSCSSGKQCHSSNNQSQGGSSVDGSMSTNTAAERNAEYSGEGQPDSTSAAAAAAVAAEALALGGGALPSGALKMAPKLVVGTGEKSREDAAGESMEPIRPKTEPVELHSNQAETTRLRCDSSGQRTDGCVQANKTGTEGTAVSLGRSPTSGTRVEGVTSQHGLKQKGSDTTVKKGSEKESSTTDVECGSDQNRQKLPERSEHTEATKSDGNASNADGKCEAKATKALNKDAQRSDGKNEDILDMASNSGRINEASEGVAQRRDSEECEGGKRGGESEKGSRATRAFGEQDGKATEEAGTSSKKVCEKHAEAGERCGDGVRTANRAESQRKAGSEARMKMDCGESAKGKATNVREKETTTQMEKGSADGNSGEAQQTGHNEESGVTTGGRKRAADEEDERCAKRARREEGSEEKDVEMRDLEGGGRSSEPVPSEKKEECGRAAANGAGNNGACR